MQKSVDNGARLRYFDVLKGIAIYMVVMGHVLTFCIRGIDSAIVFKAIGLIHMPLFFFISGYFTLKQTENERLRIPDMWKRFLQLIVPMVVVSSLWIYYFPHSGLQSPLKSTWSGLWLDLWKNGYWFTLTLFLINLIYILTISIANRFKNPHRALATLSLIIGITLFTVNCHVNEEIANVIELPFVSKYYIVFMAGALCRAYPGTFNKITSSSGWFTCALLAGALLSYYVFYPWEFPEMPTETRDICQIAIHICLAIIGVYLARPWAESVSPTNRWLGLWCYLGRKSLAIYLLHYFFLFPMSFLRAPLQAMGLDVVPTFTAAAIAAALIVAVTLGVNYVIERSRVLALLLTGNVR